MSMDQETGSAGRSLIFTEGKVIQHSVTGLSKGVNLVLSLLG